MNERILASGDIRCLAPPDGWFGEATALLSLRDGGVSPPPFDSLNLGRSVEDAPELVLENERRLASSFRLPTLPARARLEHGTRCLRVTRPGTYGPIDALLTDRKGLPLWLTVADCLPVYLIAGTWIALLHAGWRGTAGGAVRAVVEELADASGIGGGQRAWIGAGVKPCCYPVTPAVAARFAPEVLETTDGKLRLDLTAAVVRELRAAGLSEERIAHSRLCTSCRSEMFYSYRRDGARSGRMAAVFWR
jgi:YfiH family protein